MRRITFQLGTWCSNSIKYSRLPELKNRVSWIARIVFFFYVGHHHWGHTQGGNKIIDLNVFYFSIVNVYCINFLLSMALCAFRYLVECSINVNIIVLNRSDLLHLC